MPTQKINILDITTDNRYRKYLIQCFTPFQIHFSNKKRKTYLAGAIPKGLKKKIALIEDKVGGQIEYGPPQSAGLPIFGEQLLIINCIWVLRKFKKRNIGERLLQNAYQDAGKEIKAFATIGFNDVLPWLSSSYFIKQGYVILDQMKTGRFYRKTPIIAYLLWKKLKANAKPPSWDKKKLYEGVSFCPAYPWLYGSKKQWGSSNLD